MKERSEDVAQSSAAGARINTFQLKFFVAENHQLEYELLCSWWSHYLVSVPVMFIGILLTTQETQKNKNYV